MARFRDINTDRFVSDTPIAPLEERTGGALVDMQDMESNLINNKFKNALGELQFVEPTLPRESTQGYVPGTDAYEEQMAPKDAAPFIWQQISQKPKTLIIDGLGKVTPEDPNFFNLPEQEQAKQIDELVASAKKAGIYQDPALQQDQTNGNELAYRSAILPVGKTKAGEIVPALPQFLEGPRKTIEDLATGQRTADQISGKEIFDLGSLFAGASPATGSGKAIAQAAGLAKNKAPGAAPLVSEPTGVETAGVLRTMTKNIGDPLNQSAIDKPTILSTTEIRAASDAIYKQADNAGVVIKNDALTNLVDDIATTVKKAGFDKDIQPKAAAVLKRFAKDANNGATPTLSEMDTLRQVARGAVTSADSNERRIAGMIISKVDDFMGKLTANDISSGNPEAAKILPAARKLWAQKAKGETIDGLFEKAFNNESNFAAGGMELALKNQFKTLANNPNKMRQFNADEQAAIRNVVRGDDTQGAMRRLGKFSPGAGFFSGVLSGEIAIHALENPTLLAIPIIGGIARAIATTRTKNAATNVSEMVRGGPEFQRYLQQLDARNAETRNTLGSGLQRSGLLELGQQ